MSASGPSDTRGIYLRIAGGILLIVLAGVAGSVLGSWQGSRRTGSAKAPPPEGAPQSAAQSGDQTFSMPRPKPPFFFYASAQPGADLEAVAGEVKLAAASGIHEYIVGISLPWPGLGPNLDTVLYPLDRIEQENPEASILLSISLNPPEAWFDAHPEAAAVTGEGLANQPSITSEVWLRDAKQALSDLLAGLEATPRGEPVTGFVLGALEDNRWLHSGDYDRSEANQAGFRAWLRNEYPDPAALQTAWGDPDLDFATVTPPEKPDTSDASRVFFELPAEQRHVDYLRYLSESTADAIAGFAAHVQQNSSRIWKIYVPYGYSFELTANDTGHCALGLLLDSNVDGFISPVSYVDRGLGGVGGFMGPVNSAGYHGKQWLILDDTRTGISRNAVTGAIEKIEGLRTEDVMRVQRRNYASALANGLGLVWADTQGVGSLHDSKMWEMFKGMRDTYDSVWNSADAPAAGAFIEYPTPEKRVTLCVVVDEASRFYQRCDARLNERILLNLRDCVLRTGAPTQFCLLQDVLNGYAPPASVYLFANAFNLHDEDRNRIHAHLIQHKSTAIWIYAPGYIGDVASVDTIGAVTGLPVRQFDKPTTAGSVYQLDGGIWIKKGQEFGQRDTWSPLFYIDLPSSKVLARYKESQQPSVAIEFFEEGWASVYIAEPAVTTEMLREILLILEHHVAFRRGPTQHADVAYFGPNLFAIHASTDGEHHVYFSEPFDLEDVLNPDIGWFNKLFVPIPMKMGETRILRLVPAISDELPEEAPEEVEEGATNAADELDP
ncbi:MAG: hypothetical protein AMXMBFR4_20820 [Candidatus Hydrogenedentota bacterium]